MASTVCLLYLISFVLAYSVNAAKRLKEDSLEEDIFGYIDKKPVKRYTWKNKNDFMIQAITYGARLSVIKVPDKNGNSEDILLGFDDLEGYLGDNPYFGAIQGRVGNRIGGANFSLDGETYYLIANEPGRHNTLSGGVKGFDKLCGSLMVLPVTERTEFDLKVGSDICDGRTQRWSCFLQRLSGFPYHLIPTVLYACVSPVPPSMVPLEVLWEPYVNGKQLILSYISEEGENGFPGTVLTQVTYELFENTFCFSAHAYVTKPTPINILNHGHYNLAGQNSGPEGIYEHVVSINADKYTELTPDELPTELRVKGKVHTLSFRELKLHYKKRSYFMQKIQPLPDLTNTTGGKLNFSTSGKILPVDGSVFDLRNMVNLGKTKQQIDGYDHNFCVNVPEKKEGLHYVGTIGHPESGRAVKIFSTQPGVQFYTGTHLPKKGSDNPIVGKGGTKYIKDGALFMEPQHFPDAVHHPNFPSIIVCPDKPYYCKTCYEYYTIE